MRRHTRAGRLIALLCTVSLVGGCAESAPNTAHSGPTTLRVAMFGAGSTLPVRVAIDRGMFERHGMRIELTEGHDLPVFMAALAKNQYDVVMSSPTLALIGTSKNIDLQIISSMQRSSRDRPNAVWITRDPSVDSLAKLEGKSIAVPSLTGIIADATVYLLSRQGVDRSEVRFVAAPFATMGDQLAAGNVDAAVASIPFNDTIAARGFRLHDDVIAEAVRQASNGAVDTAMTSVWASTRAFARDNPETVTAWRAAISDAIAFLDENPDEARALMHDWLKIPPQILARSPLPDWDVAISPQELRPYVEISKAVGAIRTDPDVDALVWQGP